MKISAIIPAFNSAAYIGEAIASIHRQTHPVDEIIVVDDGSSDNTREVVWASDPKAVYIRQENQGPSAARNRGIEAAGGDWIAFLDADDQWTADRIEAQLAALERHPELHLIASDMAEIDHEGSSTTPSVLARHDLLDHFQWLDGKPVPDALATLMRKNFIPTGTVLVRRSSLMEAGLFNSGIRFGEDLELWARIAARHPITCLPEVHMLRRQHGNNATQSTFLMFIDLVKVTESVRRHCAKTLESQGLDPDRLVADAWSDLGYWHFVNGSYPDARKAFKSSLRETITKRALWYGIACGLPATLIHRLRSVKQMLDRPTD